MNALKEFITALIISSMGDFDHLMEDASDALTGNSLFVLDLDAAVGGITGILRPFCMVVIGICLMIELAQTASRFDVMRLEHGLKVAVKMVLAVVMIDTAPVFLRACYVQATAWINGIGGTFFVTYDLGDMVSLSIEPMVDSVNSLFSAIGLLVSVAVVVLAIKICGIVIAVMAFGRMFELCVYYAVSPLPCAFFPLGGDGAMGFNRITAKFLRGFAAVCLQGVMMLVCIGIFGNVMRGTILAKAADIELAVAGGAAGSVGVSDMCFALLLGCIVLVMSIVKCGSWAKSILDAA